jgi:hypothetical protein
MTDEQPTRNPRRSARRAAVVFLAIGALYFMFAGICQFHFKSSMSPALYCLAMFFVLACFGLWGPEK